MIIFVFIALGIVTYNQAVDKPINQPTTKEIYEAKKKDRQ